MEFNNQNRDFSTISKPLQKLYVTDECNVIDEFYAPILQNSVHYVRAAGFFRSSVYRLMTEDMLDFAIDGGKMTLITSVKLSQSDYESISSSMANQIFMDEIREMRKHPEQVQVIEMLGSLISCGCMTVKIGIRKSGIYHRKRGYFVDSQGRKVVFTGSGNETFTALHPDVDEGNAEDFEIYWDWEEEGSWKGRGEEYFRRLESEAASSGAPSTKIMTINKVPKEFFDFIDEGIDILDLERHREFASKQKIKMRKLWEENFGKGKVEEGIDEIHETELAKSIVLRPHQDEGVIAWRENGHRGVLKHATASGKTVTAISQLRNHVSEGFPALIIVPGDTLLYQWEEEVLRFIPDAQILLVGGNNKWKGDIADYMDDAKWEDMKRVVIAIDESAKTAGFLERVGSLENALVIVDECHNIGAPGFHGIWQWRPQKIMGLSATPERYGDGTLEVFTLCGQTVHEYPIEQALRDGYLTPYNYNIERVSLTEAEAHDFDHLMGEVTRQLSRYSDGEGGIDWGNVPEYLKILIFNARRILKRAEMKTEKCADIIEQNFVDDGSQRWLIYCQDGPHLNEVRQEIQGRGIGRIYEFWSRAEGAYIDGERKRFQRDETLKMWESTGGLLLAINCLDEGVNIPSISHGIILASTKNTRQFIQRRGRLLRLSENKTHANIWDTLVIPDMDVQVHNDFVFDEINRAAEFANMATNIDCRIELSNIRAELGLRGEFPEEDD